MSRSDPGGRRRSSPVNLAPVAAFTYVVSGGSATFTDASSDPDGTIASRAWDFGDGTSSTSTNPSHTYATTGTYTVVLTVTDNGHRATSKATAVSVSIVGGNTPPSANFTSTVDADTATFTDTSTDSDGTIVSRAWDFGDGTASQTITPISHTFARSGTYQVALTVTDNDGATGTTSKSVTVVVAGSPGLIVMSHLAFDVPDRPTLRSSPRRVWPDLFVPHLEYNAHNGNRPQDRDAYEAATGTRYDTVQTTSGSFTVLDSSCVAGDVGYLVTGPGINVDTYVKTVNPGVSFTIWTKKFTASTATPPSQPIMSPAYQSGTSTAVVRAYPHYPDYYDSHLSAEGQPVHGGAYAGNNSFGGMYRNHPLRRADQGTNFVVEDFKRQVQFAYDGGCDGFAVELLIAGTTDVRAQNQLKAFDAVHALGLDGDFDMLMEPDLSGGWKNFNQQQLVDVLRLYWVKPSQTKVAGKAQVVVFFPEFKSGAFWAGVQEQMLHPTSAELARTPPVASMPVEFIMCQVNSNATGTVYTTFDAGNAAYASCSRLLGRWGDRDPVTSGNSNHLNRSLTAWVRSQYSRGAFACVSTGDQRPNGHRWWEPRGTENFRVQWDCVINGDKPTGVATVPPQGSQMAWQDQKADANFVPSEAVGIHTYNDYAENSGVSPSRNTGYAWLDINWYYLIKYKLGYWPTIVRDTIYLSHKVEFGTSTHQNTAETAPQSHTGATPSSDTVEALVFASGPGTVEIVGGDDQVVDLFSVPTAGLYVFTAPMRAGAGGALKARMTRGGQTVSGTSITSPWAISHTGWVTDKCIRIGSSRRGWSSSNPDVIPAQPTHGVPIT